MYNQESAKIAEPYSSTIAEPYSSTPEKTERSALGHVHDKLSKQNAEYSMILYEVEEKLHSIKSLRTPDKVVENGIDKGGKEDNDFVTAITHQLEIMSQYNSRLEKVLKHIKAIV